MDSDIERKKRREMYLASIIAAGLVTRREYCDRHSDQLTNLQQVAIDAVQIVRAIEEELENEGIDVGVVAGQEVAAA